MRQICLPGRMAVVSDGRQLQNCGGVRIRAGAVSSARIFFCGCELHCSAGVAPVLAGHDKIY